MESVIIFTAGMVVGVLGVLVAIKLLMVKTDRIKASHRKIEVGDMGWYVKGNKLYECRVVEVINEYSLHVYLTTASMRGAQDIEILRVNFRPKEE